MFIPKIYKSEDFNLMKKIIRENAFGLLMSNNERLLATHSMFLLNGTEEKFHLETHISKANPQSKILKNDDEVLCDFLGAHSYISSSWYQKTNVSTWNYQAVQIRGKVKIMTNDELYNHLDQLTRKYETTQKCPMQIEKMGNEFVEKEMKGAFGINICPMEIHIANKLSQNRNENDFENIVINLNQSENENAKRIAEEMMKIKIGL